MVLWCFLFVHVEWSAYSCFVLSVMHLLWCYAVYIWFHVECLKSKREREWVSIVSLPEWEVPARSAVKHPQGVRWQRIRVYLWKLRRDTVVHKSVEVQARNRSRARCAQARWDLRTYKLRLRDWRIVVVELHRVKRFKYSGIFEEVSQGVHAKVF